MEKCFNNSNVYNDGSYWYSKEVKSFHLNKQPQSQSKYEIYQVIKEQVRCLDLETYEVLVTLTRSIQCNGSLILPFLDFSTFLTLKNVVEWLRLLGSFLARNNQQIPKIKLLNKFLQNSKQQPKECQRNSEWSSPEKILLEIIKTNLIPNLVLGGIIRLEKSDIER